MTTYAYTTIGDPLGFRSSIEVNPNEINNLGQIAGDYQDRSAVDGTDSRDRGMGRLGLQNVKAHRPRFRALCFHAVPDGL